jgi:hypothetical protein
MQNAILYSLTAPIARVRDDRRDER